MTLDDAFDCWLGKNGLAQNSCTLPDQPPTERAVPLILVATTGGGIRAGYWTDLVLDCAFEVEPGKTCPTGEHLPGFGRSDRLFALSGVSGGSLGLTEYAAYLSEKRTRGVEPGWVERSLHADTLSASGAWWLFVEIPRAFLQFRSPTDRAGILERSWERQWKHGELGQGLLQLWRTDHHQPLLLLNGTSVEDGCRFETSPLDVDVKTATVKNASVKEVTGTVTGCKSTEPFDAAGGVAPQSVLPATRDLGDFLCGQDKDVRLSTAALLSARFPFVNPAARVASQCPHPNGKPQVAYVVDGGYLDTSGASPIVELMTRLQPLVDGWNIEHKTDGTCIVPLMIQIDNGFAAGPPRSPRRPGELLIPLNTVFKTRGAREAEARVGAALLFGGSAVGAPIATRTSSTRRIPDRRRPSAGRSRASPRTSSCRSSSGRATSVRSRRSPAGCGPAASPAAERPGRRDAKHGLSGADPGYDCGLHFVFQGHENGAPVVLPGAPSATRTPNEGLSRRASPRRACTAPSPGGISPTPRA